MVEQTTFDFIIMLLILGGIAFICALIGHAIKRYKRKRMIDSIDHRKWKK